MTGKTITRTELAQSLEQQIMDGELQEGTKLRSERSLASENGVGRPAIREAIRELSERGLVETVPGRGTYVARPRVASVASGIQRWVQWQRISPHEILDARKLVEIAAAASAASRDLGHELVVMNAVLQRLEHENHPVRAAHLDVGFHLCIARASGNPVLELLLSSLAPITAELILLSGSFEGVTSARKSQHDAILTALSDHDPNAARDAMESHLATGREGFVDAYDRPIVDSGVVIGLFDLDDLLEQHRLPSWTGL